MRILSAAFGLCLLVGCSGSNGGATISNGRGPVADNLPDSDHPEAIFGADEAGEPESAPIFGNDDDGDEGAPSIFGDEPAEENPGSDPLQQGGDQEDDGEPQSDGQDPAPDVETAEDAVVSSDGACTNSADTAAIDALLVDDEDNEALDNCNNNCLFGSLNEDEEFDTEAFASCQSGCLVEHGNFTSACASCISTAFVCEIENCAEIDDDDERESCREAICLSAFKTCAGIDWPE